MAGTPCFAISRLVSARNLRRLCVCLTAARFFSERQAKVTNFGKFSPGPVHLPYSGTPSRHVAVQFFRANSRLTLRADFGAPPPLSDDHWLIKNSPMKKYERELADERRAKLTAPLLGTMCLRC